MNRWAGIGRLTKSPELKYSQQGTAVCKFTLAINRRFKRDVTDFIDVVAFKALAENCANYLDKGKVAYVTGELQMGSYENKQGQKVKTVQVMADEVEFLSPKGESKANSKDPWDDLGREVRLEDVDIADDDEIPF